MIYKKQYGHPFDTESVVGSFVPAMETIPYLTREPDGFSYAMDPQDILYGLGENIRGINKRGWVYESKCSDDPNHTENKSSLYGAYNFMIVSGKDTFGFFIDYPGKVTFDCGYTDLDTLRVTVAEENYDLYIIEGESPTDIVHQFRQLVGRSYIPPKWAFGATQSRWSYMNEDEVREVVANYRTNNMPLDAVVLDIDYMERYKDFTVDEQRFPHFKGKPRCTFTAFFCHLISSFAPMFSVFCRKQVYRVHAFVSTVHGQKAQSCPRFFNFAALSAFSS